MIDMRYKPAFLPQVNMPFGQVLEKLDGEGITYQLIEVDPNELNASQGITFSDEVSGVALDDMKPIWVGENMKILDGHHRWVKAMSTGAPIKAVKINMNDKDACRLLNKFQDLYEYEQARELEEITTQQNNINTENSIDSDGSSREFLNMLEETNAEIQEEPTRNSKNIIAYRKEPIKENSVIGNFFTLKPMEGFSRYEIEFDNILDTNDLGIAYKTDQQPVEILAKIWFPHINFEKLSELHKTTPINLKNKAIAEKAMKMGYDGIKYGDSLVQGLK